MRVAIVYESLYGNTHEIAEAIAAGVNDGRPKTQVELLPIGPAGCGPPTRDAPEHTGQGGPPQPPGWA